MFVESNMLFGVYAIGTLKPGPRAICDERIRIWGKENLKAPTPKRGRLVFAGLGF